MALNSLFCADVPLSNYSLTLTTVAIACYFILLYCMAAFVNH